MVSSPEGTGFFTDGFRKPSSILISGTDRTLLKWFAFAALTPHTSRVYWTDVRLPGEILDPLDPMALHAVPEESVYVLSPRELGPDDQTARMAESAAATVIRSDEPESSIQGLIEFLRMPLHAQKLISSTGRRDIPSILVTANSQRLASVYSPERIGPLMQALLEAGTCQVALWAEAPTTMTSMFDQLLHLEGGGPADWRSATLRSDKGPSSTELGLGETRRLSELPSIAPVLDQYLRAHSK